jgi:hypothetical protein
MAQSLFGNTCGNYGGEQSYVVKGCRRRHRAGHNQRCARHVMV